jgi:tetratricopeptide (TPR) repeat protein
LITRALSYRQNARDMYMRAYIPYRTGDYAKAIPNFESVLALSADKNSLTWIEASWLTLLESYLLSGDYAAVEQLGERASKVALGTIPESQVVVAYLRLVARTLKAAAADAGEPIDFDKQLEQLGTLSSVQTLLWDNGKIQLHLESWTGPGRSTVDKLSAYSRKLFARTDNKVTKK